MHAYTHTHKHTHVLSSCPMYAAAAAAKLPQSCPTLCDPVDGSPPGSPVPGILQARTLEWVAISFSNAWKWKVKVKSLSHVQLLATPWTAAYRLLHPWDSPGKSTGVGCHCLLRTRTLRQLYFIFGCTVQYAGLPQLAMEPVLPAVETEWTTGHQGSSG